MKQRAKRLSHCKIPVRLVSQICIEPQPRGLRAVYLVETRGEREAADLAEFFEDFVPTRASDATGVQRTAQLSAGKLVSYAVQLHSQDQSLFEEIEKFLKRNFGFVVMHRSFNTLIYNIVQELCRDLGSCLIPIPKCDICRSPEPFPEATISFLDKRNIRLATRFCCARCSAELVGRGSKELVAALLQTDRGGSDVLRRMEPVRSLFPKECITFRVKRETEGQRAQA